MLYQLSYSRSWQKRSVARPAQRFLVGRGGFEPPKASPTDLQSVPFDRSGTSPGSPIQQKNRPRKAKNSLMGLSRFVFFSIKRRKTLPGLIELSGAGEGNRTPNLLITNQLLCRLSYASPGYLPRFFQKSNITLELKCCQGKNAGTRWVARGSARARTFPRTSPLEPCDWARSANVLRQPPPAGSEFRLDLSYGFGVSFLCEDLPRPREIERK